MHAQTQPDLIYFRRICRNWLKGTSSNLSRQTVMSKFANAVTIEVAPGRRDRFVTLLLAHKARLKDEPGTRSAAAERRRYESSRVRNVPGRRRIRGASERAVPRAMERGDRRNGGEASWGAVRGRGLVGPLTCDRQPLRI